MDTHYNLADPTDGFRRLGVSLDPDQPVTQVDVGNIRALLEVAPPDPAVLGRVIKRLLNQVEWDLQPKEEEAAPPYIPPTRTAPDPGSPPDYPAYEQRELLARLLADEPERLHFDIEYDYAHFAYAHPAMYQTSGLAKAKLLRWGLRQCTELAQALEQKAAASTHLSYTLQHLNTHLALLIGEYETRSGLPTLPPIEGPLHYAVTPHTHLLAQALRFRIEIMSGFGSLNQLIHEADQERGLDMGECSDLAQTAQNLDIYTEKLNQLLLRELSNWQCLALSVYEYAHPLLGKLPSPVDKETAKNLFWTAAIFTDIRLRANAESRSFSPEELDQLGDRWPLLLAGHPVRPQE